MKITLAYFFTDTQIGKKKYLLNSLFEKLKSKVSLKQI